MIADVRDVRRGNETIVDKGFRQARGAFSYGGLVRKGLRSDSSPFFFFTKFSTVELNQPTNIIIIIIKIDFCKDLDQKQASITCTYDSDIFVIFLLHPTAASVINQSVRQNLILLSLLNGILSRERKQFLQ